MPTTNINYIFSESLRVANREDYMKLKSHQLLIKEIPVLVISDGGKAEVDLDSLLQKYQLGVEFEFPTEVSLFRFPNLILRHASALLNSL